MHTPLRLLAATALIASTLPHAHAQEAALACEGRQTSQNTGELLCPVAPSAGPVRLRVVADFNGVHDDSRAEVLPSLEGTRIACDAGGQPRLEGDAQGSRLSCAFTLQPSAASRKLLLVVAFWHAEPARVQVLPQ